MLFPDKIAGITNTRFVASANTRPDLFHATKDVGAQRSSKKIHLGLNGLIKTNALSPGPGFLLRSVNLIDRRQKLDSARIRLFHIHHETLLALLTLYQSEPIRLNL